MDPHIWILSNHLNCLQCASMTLYSSNMKTMTSLYPMKCTVDTDTCRFLSNYHKDRVHLSFLVGQQCKTFEYKTYKFFNTAHSQGEIWLFKPILFLQALVWYVTPTSTVDHCTRQCSWNVPFGQNNPRSPSRQMWGEWESTVMGTKRRKMINYKILTLKRNYYIGIQNLN